MKAGSAIRLTSLLAAAALGSAGTLTAQEGLTDLPSFREGCRALADERFDTAKTRFLECWDLLAEREVSGPENGFVAARLLESFVRGGESAAAIDWHTGHEAVLDPTSQYWLALALQQQERYAEAIPHYQNHLTGSVEPRSSARLDLAICLTRSGSPDDAWDLIAATDLPTNPAERLRHAQIAAAAGRSEEALAIAGAIVKEGSGVDPGLVLPLLRLRAALHLRLNDRAAAAEVLYTGIESAADPSTIRRAFVLMEALFPEGPPPGLGERLDQWEKRTDSPLSEAAALFRIILLGKEAGRATALRAFTERSPSPALLLEARLRLGEAGDPEAPALGDDDPAPDLLERLDHVMADAAFREGRYGEAAGLFASFSELLSGESAARNRYNAAIAALKNNDPAAFAEHEKACQANDPRSPYLVDLGYLGGLYFASRGDATAFDRLSAFVLENPDHPANVDARLALAEIHLNQAPARAASAREISEGLSTRPLTLDQSERLDYIAIWIDLIEGNSSDLLRRAGEFVSSWPSSNYRAEVLMILASEHYRRKSRDEAAAIFRQVATEFPDSPFALPAKFFEAKSLPPSAEALARWQALADEEGPLSREASHEMALLQVTLDRFTEARATLERLIDSTPEGEPLRFAAMADLGYTCYLEGLAGREKTEALEEAARRFATLSNLTTAPAFWRYQAAVRRGKCLEALDKDTVALEIYRSIVEETRSLVAPLSPGEIEWVFRAGFAAIDLLGTGRDWASAIRIADTLSEKNGPRSIEATRLAERLRLQHWIWD